MGSKEERKEESKANKEEVAILTEDQLSHFVSNINDNYYKMTQIELS